MKQCPSLKRIILITVATLFTGNLLGGLLTGGTESGIADIILDAVFMTLFFLTLFYFFIYRGFTGKIAELKSAEERHRTAEENLQTLLDTMPDGVWFKDGEGRWMVVNKAGLALFGLEDADYRGKRDSEQVATDNFHYPALCYCQETDKAAWELGRPSRVEERIPQPGGAFRTFDVIKAPLFNPDGSRKGLVVLGHDISVEKEALAEQSRLANVVEQADESIFITDARGMFVFVNPAFEKESGYRRDELIGKHVSILMSDRLPKEFYSGMWETAMAGSVWRGTLINRRKDGSVYEAHVVLSPVHDANGVLTNLASVQRDASRENRLERARQYFAAVTSHEMGTPLTKLRLLKIMLGNLRPFMNNHSLLGEVEENMGRVYSEFERIADLTSLLVQLSTTPAPGTLRSFPLRQHILNIVNRAITTIETEHRRVTLEMDIEPLSTETLAVGDAGIIEAALNEVISNAVKYTKDGGVIRVAAAETDNSAVITLTDEGIGMPPERLHEALDPFYSLENPYHHSTGQFKFKGGGLGIGLTVAALAMKQNGGSLELKSAGENKGTIVTLRLPLA